MTYRVRCGERIAPAQAGPIVRLVGALTERLVQRGRIIRDVVDELAVLGLFVEFGDVNLFRSLKKTHTKTMKNQPSVNYAGNNRLHFRHTLQIQTSSHAIEWRCQKQTTCTYTHTHIHTLQMREATCGGGVVFAGTCQHVVHRKPSTSFRALVDYT